MSRFAFYARLRENAGLSPEQTILVRPQIKELSYIFRGKIKKSSILRSNKVSVYRKFSPNTELSLSNYKGGKEKLDVYCINHVNAYRSELETFLRNFHGVSTKYLNNYLIWFLSVRKECSEKKNKQYSTELAQ